MTDSRKPSIALWAAVIVVAVVMLPFMYIASLGPLYFLVGNGTIDEQTWEVLAQPAMFCGEHSGYWPGWFWRLCEGYIEWWGWLAE